MDPTRPTPGQPIEEGQQITAEWLNALLTLWQGNRIITPRDASLTSQPDPLGTLLMLDLDAMLVIKITGGGTGGKYAWTEQVETSGGGWADTSPAVTGTTSDDPAYEINGVASVAVGSVVPAWRTISQGDLRFLSSTC